MNAMRNKNDFQAILGLAGRLGQFSVKKVTIHGIIGGIAVYAAARSAGISENVSILLGVVSAGTSGVSAVADTNKDNNNG